MSTILIADDELTTVKNIFNNIVQKNNEVKLIGISTNGKETLHIMQNTLPDILLLDLMMPEMNGIELLDKLIEEKEKYLIKMKVIVISSYTNKIYNNNKYRDFIYAILPKPYSISQLLKLIEEINIQIKNKNIKEYIEETLNKFNFNKKSNAYNYLKDAIYLIICEGKNNFLLEKDIYKKVAKINKKKNEIVIKWSIEKLMNNMYMDTKYSTVKEYFGNEAKITTKIFIRAIMNNFNKDLENKNVLK